MAYLELSFFNSFDVNAQGKRVANFRSAKVAGLLVYLVLEAGATHPRDRLAALFWPDEPETRAKKNLRQTLYQLRKLVGETDSYGQPLLDVTRQTVQFNAESDTVLDVALFQAAVARGDLDLAETYYTGPLLPTFNCDSRPFDEWLVRKRHAFQKAALGSMHELAESRWRRVNSPHLVALVAVGTKFPDGKTRILPGLPSDSVANLQADATLEPVIHNI